MKIIGYYKDLILMKKDSMFYVVNRIERKILYKGNEEMANKVFVMMLANFINENLEVESH